MADFDRNRPRTAPSSVLAVMVLVASLVAISRAEPARTEEPRRLTDLEESYRKAVLRGWRVFQTSYAADGVACVDCHPHHEALRGWAGAYPKVQVFDGSPYQVKGIRETFLEVLGRHTELAQSDRVALVEDLVAYLAWWGDGEPVSPGRSRAQIEPPDGDLAALAAAAERGRVIVRSAACTSCHGGDEDPADGRSPLSVAARLFPRYVPTSGRVLSLESYLAEHASRTGQAPWLSEISAATDQAAYLMQLGEGRALRPGGSIRETRE